ncbi:MAG: hypothetical protein C0594_16730 [Marinilabiliales bacterium]|nr:MAG: hypothetical protein C0594_16730 [Marinilabiliales bacterium]
MKPIKINIKKVQKTIWLLVIILLPYLCLSQVSINTNGAAPDASSMLDVTSTNSGILIPRMTQVQRNAISSPATGLLIYQTDNSPGFYYYDGSTWSQVGKAGWDLTGNTGTTAGTNFVGTTDGTDLVVKTNNTERMRITSTGKVGIGDSSPSSALTVGASDQFQVDASGDIVKIDGVTYDWPSANGTGTLLNDGSGNLTWAGVGWQKVAYVDLVNETSYTVTGLNGNTDIGYKIILVGTHASASGSQLAYVRPNGDANSSNYATSVDGYAVASSSDTWFNDPYGGAGMLLWATYSTDRVTADGIFNAGTGQQRHVVTRYSLYNAGLGDTFINLSAGVWKNTTTNITSLQFIFQGSGFTGKLIIYAMR